MSYNNSSETMPNDPCHYYQFSIAEIWITSILYILIIIASFVGNCTIIWIVYFSPQMRTVSHYFIINMAVADLLITVFGMPVAVKEQIKDTAAIEYGGFRGEILCKMLEYTKDVSISCSILSLVAIATDRFCATLIPFKRLITLSRAKVIMAIIWIISLVITVPLLIVTKVMLDGNEYYCYEDWTMFSSDSMERSYTVALFVVLYAAPLIIISILYGAIIRKVWKRKIPGQPTVRGREIQLRTKKNVLKMFMTVVVCFMVCWIPYHVVFFVYNFGCPTPTNIWFFSLFMGHANSSITPWIYVIFGREYRKEFKLILLKAGLGKRPRFPSSSYRNGTMTLGETRNASKASVVTLTSFTNVLSSTSI